MSTDPYFSNKKFYSISVINLTIDTICLIIIYIVVISAMCLFTEAIMGLIIGINISGIIQLSNILICLRATFSQLVSSK